MRNEREITGPRLNEIGTLKVLLASAGNPDHGEDPEHPVPGVPKGTLNVKSIAEASAACRKYIDTYGLGGGNWTGGDVTKDGEIIARISYNGRAWEEIPSEASHPTTADRPRQR